MGYRFSRKNYAENPRMYMYSDVFNTDIVAGYELDRNAILSEIRFSSSSLNSNHFIDQFLKVIGEHIYNSAALTIIINKKEAQVEDKSKICSLKILHVIKISYRDLRFKIDYSFFEFIRCQFEIKKTLVTMYSGLQSSPGSTEIDLQEYALIGLVWLIILM